MRAGGRCGHQVDAEGEVAGLAAGGVEEAGREDAGGDRFGRFTDGGEVPRVGLPAGFSGYAGGQRAFSEAARGDEEVGDEILRPVLECFQEELFRLTLDLADEHEAGDGRERALDAYAKARQVAATAPRLSLDPAMTAFQLGGILASLSLKA